MLTVFPFKRSYQMFYKSRNPFYHHLHRIGTLGDCICILRLYLSFITELHTLSYCFFQALYSPCLLVYTALSLTIVPFSQPMSHPLFAATACDWNHALAQNSHSPVDFSALSVLCQLQWESVLPSVQISRCNSIGIHDWFNNGNERGENRRMGVN